MLAVRAGEGSTGTGPFSSISVINGDEWSDSGPCGLNRRDRTTGTLCIEHREGPITGLDVMKRDKSLAPVGNGTAVPQSSSP